MTTILSSFVFTKMLNIETGNKRTKRKLKGNKNEKDESKVPSLLYNLPVMVKHFHFSNLTKLLLRFHLWMNKPNMRLSALQATRSKDLLSII